MSARTDPLELLAAVSGPFEPLALAPQGDPAALGPLSVKCDEVIEDGKLRWMLKGDHRRAALAKLDSPAAARKLIGQAPKPASEDLFTSTLRAALLGTQKAGWRQAQQGGAVQPLDRLDQAQQRDFAIQSALQFAGHAGYLELKSPLAATRGRLSQRRGQLALRATLPTKLIGRRADLRKLLAFAARRGKPDPLPFYLTGLGGVGKSALVAALLLELQKSKALAVLVDFDAVGMARGEPVPVFLAIMHQYAQLVRARGHEAHAEKLGAARNLIQAKTRDRGTGSKGSAVEEQFSTISGLGLPVLGKVPAPLRREPTVLIFDSFEVVPPRHLPAVMRLFELLQRNVPLPGLRLIVSGRELPPATPSPLSAPVAPDPGHHILLEGLKDKDGARFLAAYDIEGKFTHPALRERATRAVKGHPLALLVLERFGRNQPSEEIKAVLGELERDPGFAAEFAQSFLYTRVLDRISDPLIARLAHPGLILREVTPGLIRLVLAKPCELGEIGDPEAADLLERLGEHYWLVQSLGPHHLRHRSDVRRMMIPSMLAGPRPGDPAEVAARKEALRQRSLEAASAAAAFWRNGPARGDSARALFDAKSPEERWVEATYYAALAGEPPPPQLSAEQAGMLERGIGKDDLATLKPSWRGEIKMARRDFDGLTRHEIDALGVASRATYETDAIDRTLKTGASKDAAAMALAEQDRSHEQRQLEEAQVLLRDAGYYNVRIDGVLGPAMRRALTDLGVKVALETGTELLLREIRRRLGTSDANPDRTAKHETRAPDAAFAGPGPGPTPGPAHPRGQELTVELAESRAAADFESGNCDPKVVELLIHHLLSDSLPSSVRGEIEKGRLWNTGLWKGALAAAALSIIPLDGFSWSRGIGRSPVLDTAIILMSGLFGAGRDQEWVNLEHLEWIVSRSDGWLEGNDGLRLVLRIARLMDANPKVPFMTFDGSALALLASDGLINNIGMEGLNSAWFSDNPNSTFAKASPALFAQGPTLDRYRRLLTMQKPGLADFDAAWSTNFAIRADLAQLLDARQGRLRELQPQWPELVLATTRVLNQLDPLYAAAVVNRVAWRALCWPRELWFEGPDLPTEHSKGARRFDPEWCFAVVQTSDRCGVLGQLLEELRVSPDVPQGQIDRLQLIHSHLTYNFALSQSSSPRNIPFTQGELS